VGDVDRTRDFHCATILGSKKAHQVQLVNYQNLTMLEYCDISCFLLTIKTLQYPSHVNRYIDIFISSLMCFISMHKCSLQVS